MRHTFRVLLRVLRFARPYRVRLAVGLLAGFVAGGSLFGVLRFAPNLLVPFEARPPAALVHTAAEPAPVPESTAAAAARAKGVAPKGMGTVQRLADRLQLPTVKPDGTMTWQFMLLAIIGLPLCFTFKSMAAFVNHYYLRWVGARVVADVRNALFDKLMRQSLRYFGKVDVGHLISRITYDANQIEATISGTVADLTQAPMEVVASVAFIIWFAVDHGLTEPLLLIVVLFPVGVIPVLLLGRSVKRWSRNALKRISDLVSRMQESFTGIRVIKAFHTENLESRRFAQANRTYVKSTVRAIRAELAVAPLMEILGALGAILFLVYCYARGITLSHLLPLGMAVMFAYRPVKQLAKLNAHLQRGVAAAERIFAILDTHMELPEKPGATAIDAFRDRIVFDAVSFAYDPGATPVVTGLAFSIPRGTMVACVGETGAGKTTVAALLARFYDPSAGRVLLDGQDLRDLRIDSLRRLIGVVTQETILFNDTIAANIAYGMPEATREQVIDAARKANAHEFIMAEPEGYDRVVGEKGFRLSGGQRQRIAIARAILRNPPILVLDEAMSALDTVTEKLVQEALTRLMQERTVFAIAHRLSTVKHAHEILVLDKGRLVERGTHASLYAAGGIYRRLCDSSQFSSEPPA